MNLCNIMILLSFLTGFSSFGGQTFLSSPSDPLLKKLGSNPIVNTRLQLPGGDGSGGGSATGVVFTALGRLVQRTMVSDPLVAKIADGFEIRVDAFEEKLNSVHVEPVAVSDIPKRKDKAKIEALLVAYGESASAIYDSEQNWIYVFNERFDADLERNPAAALATCTHEYLRAMGLTENFYENSGALYSEGFFHKILAEPRAQEVFYGTVVSAIADVETKSTIQDFDLKRLELIEAEIHKMESSEEAAFGILKILAIDLDKLESQAAADSLPNPNSLRALGRAMNELMSSVNGYSILSNPLSGKAGGNTVEKLLDAQAAAAELRPLSTIRTTRNHQEVLQDQLRYLKKDREQTRLRLGRYIAAKDKIILGE